MREYENLLQAVETVAANPRVAATSAAATTAVGAASAMNALHDTLSIASMGVGITTGLVVLAIQILKLVRNIHAWRRDMPSPKDE